MFLTEDSFKELLINFKSRESFFSSKNLKYAQCAICLNILNSPLQCKTCGTLICSLCSQVFDSMNKKCFGICDGTYKKASKFLREALKKLNINCNKCQMEMPYNLYYTEAHSLKCLPDVIIKEKFLLEINIKDNAIEILESVINGLSQKKKLYHKYNNSKLLEMPIDELRKILMTFDLTIDCKMELYYACTGGKLTELKNLINNKKYPILEEISFKGYYWTPLHYSMHYGQYDIINYILNLLKDDNIMEPALRLESNDQRCPVMCLLKSNHLNITQKEELFEKLLKEYNLTLSKEVKKEAISRNFEKIIKKYNKM